VSWTIIVPLKSLPAAKSRLAAASGSPLAHKALVDAIRADTLAAAGFVGRIFIVADRELGPDLSLPAGLPMIVQREPGLNAALAEAAAVAADQWPESGIAAIVGDLPSLRPDDLRDALARADEHPRSFVPDASGLGTTLLAVRPGTDLAPAFGLGSAARHAAGAQRLDAAAGLRLDVDTAEDLEAARELGVGPATRAVLGW
jgi:2-phospho-L-lactate guanylyltransferase